MLLIVGVLTSGGCGISTTATFIREPPEPRVPRPAESVEIFSAGRPTRPHLDVALLESEQQSAHTTGDTAELIADMREEAGRLGCDALVLGSTYFRVDNVSTILSGDTSDRRGLSGTCVIYTQAPEPVSSSIAGRK